MADYLTPTVVEPMIPLADLLPIERLFLAQVFTEEIDGESAYYFSDQGASDLISLPDEAVRSALDCTTPESSRLMRKLFDEQPDAVRGDGEYSFDVCGEIWPEVLQDIVRRSTTLECLTVSIAFTCSRMRPDGFGGSAMLITAETIRWDSTTSLFERFFEEAKAAGEIDDGNS